MEEPWAGLSERTLVAMVEQIFSHLLKVLNICAHVLDDTPPGPAVKVTVCHLLVWLLQTETDLFTHVSTGLGKTCPCIYLPYTRLL